MAPGIRLHRLSVLVFVVAAITMMDAGRGQASIRRSTESPPDDSGRPVDVELPYGLSPDPQDYGPRDGLPRRTPSGSMKVTEKGSLVENLTITGSLTVAADDVTIRNVRFKAPPQWKWSQRRSFVYVAKGATGTAIVDSAFNGANGNGVPVVYDAVTGYGTITLRRCEITRVANGIEWGSGTVERCLLHDIWQSGPKSQWHADGIQSNEGSGITVRNNYIRMGRPPTGYWSQTSAIGMWADRRHDATLERVLVTRNVVEPFGGYVFYAGITNGVAGAKVSDVVFSDNVVRREGVQPSDYGVWYQTRENPIHAVRTGNVYDDGTPIPPDA
jgi:hypothetical protein